MAGMSARSSKAHAKNIPGIYERNADLWDRLRDRSLFEKTWLERFISLLPPRARTLDLGCGSGEPIAAHLIHNGQKLIGVDVSPRMIALCNERHPEETWIVGDMRSLSLGTTFDGILAWDSFFHLSPSDQRAMFPVFKRHSHAGTALLFTTGEGFEEVLGKLGDDMLYHGSLDENEYRGLLEEFGFSVSCHRKDDPDCRNHTVWLAVNAG